MSLLTQFVVLLGAAVTAVPIFRKLKLGAILGYLAAGAFVGPWGLGLIGDPEAVDEVFHLGEFGVVLLFFIIGLELHPRRLWLMRRDIFGLGGLQLFLTALPIAGIARLLGVPTPEAVLIGVALAFSSTAFALQLLAERKELNSHHGRKAFAVLLFQDIAVVPVLALIPILGTSTAVAPDSVLWIEVLKSLGLVALIVVLGRYALRYALRIVAATGVNEAFTAMSLLTVALTAVIAETAGLSMALGGFMAGVLLADSEYRHALEADLNPFKGLLLGLFFMSVGMSVNLDLFVDQVGLIIILSVGLVLLKAAFLAGLFRLAGISHAGSATSAALLSQGGEFGFVLFGAAAGVGLVSPDRLALLVAVIILSMAFTPLFTSLVTRAAPRERQDTKREWEIPDESEPRVIIAGFGRFGQIIARILHARQIPFTALELNPEQVDLANRFGNKVHYGDPTRLELLRAARVDRARVFVLALDNMDDSLRLARTLCDNFPHLTIFARARNRAHAYQLMELGISHIFRELYHSSLEMTRAVLRSLDFEPREADHIVERFHENDEERLRAGFGSHHDLEEMIAQAKESARELEALLKEDRKAGKDR
jgi:monovalent cation:proton antiporter-2 (CPA2) family protein